MLQIFDPQILITAHAGELYCDWPWGRDRMKCTPNADQEDPGAYIS